MTVFLFLMTSLLWGSGALVTTAQAGVTPAAWSVALRMALAGLLLLALGRLRGQPLRLGRGDMLFVGAQGGLFFGIAFVAFYESTARIPSGLSALVLSTSSLFSAGIGAVLLRERLTPRLVAGSVLGLIGMMVVFAPRLAGAQLGDTLTGGVVAALIASLATAAGTVAGARNQRAGVPVFAVLGWGALTGAAVSLLWAVVSGKAFVPDLSARYLGSLAYLTLAASVVTFLLYFELVKRRGAGTASYVFTTIPLIALGLSALFEGLVPGPALFIGAAAVVAGNVLVLTGRRAG